MKKMTMMITLLAATLAFTPASAQFVQGRQGSGNGPKDGTGYQGNGPKDGTGYGAKSGRRNGSGQCDGTGPQSTRQGNSRGGQSRGGRR